MEDHAARTRPFGIRQTYALDHCQRLRRPVEKDHQCPEHLAVRCAALADGGRVGGHLGVLQQRRRAHVMGDILLAAGRVQCVPELGGPGDIAADHRILLGATVGNDHAVGIEHPDILVHRIAVEDHRQAPRSVRARLRTGIVLLAWPVFKAYFRRTGHYPFNRIFISGR